MKSTQSRKDKFQMLCHVTADLSTAPYTSSFTPAGKICHKRAFDVVLLVGATGLKAQISWVDSATVRARIVLHIFICLTQLSCL